MKGNPNPLPRVPNESLKKAMIDAMEKSLGVVTTAAKLVGITRQIHYTWLLRDPKYKAAIEEIGEVALDFAESQLHKQIGQGEVASTIFYLKTKGKKRGYIERTETDINIVTAINIIETVAVGCHPLEENAN
jgi:Bacterial regulatory protein, Fis family